MLAPSSLHKEVRYTGSDRFPGWFGCGEHTIVKIPEVFGVHRVYHCMMGAFGKRHMGHLSPITAADVQCRNYTYTRIQYVRVLMRYILEER